MDGIQRPVGVSALRYHGLLHGLPLLVETPTTRSVDSPGHGPDAHTLQPDSEFVRLLANLVLRTHSELVHVY
ncbi:hypothetical protein QFZ91_005296 [Paraburkholderia sp. JPY419]